MSALHGQLVRSSEANDVGPKPDPQSSPAGRSKTPLKETVWSPADRGAGRSSNRRDRLAGPRATGDPEDVVRGYSKL